MKTAILTVAAIAALPAFSQTAQPASQQPGAPTLTVNGQVPGPFGYFRCGTPDSNTTQNSFMPPSDCSANRTVPDPIYSPANLEVLRIPVVFHVIRTSNGTGNVPDSRLNSQIDILNEDFRALSGTPGAPGTDTKIEFALATVDPNGAPTTGINRYNNSTWYSDGGSYWNTLAWDPDVYLNIYTLGAPQGSSGILGYVPFLPASSPNSVGSNSDRVVVLNSAVGRNAPAAPYNQGRTLTHEIGHFLGLNHTFNGGCGGSNCYTSGDLICDTNAESQPEYNCPANSSSCGSPDPVRNYMDYSPDTCMTNFTEEQARRIRCTLEFYRPALAMPTSPTLGLNYCVLTPNSTGGSAFLSGYGTKQLSNNDFGLTAFSLPPNSFGFFIVSNTQAQVANPAGSQGTLCVGGAVGRYLSQVGNSGLFGELSLVVDVNNVPQPNGAIAIQAGETWNFQAWYRDVNPTIVSNFSDGYTITFE
ncbi:Pregnancy-associated plasma protein-A [Planctomycetes bacterium Poly30]|uniref:Pregnancy-associated plasma protein-A n=1 Tax=Saltatorellus ferox TaxID=2528018 RepID=A0A518EUJ9_9BACT|nr:Pregnancy-associated plasma protein-A [Planctomycetes bacterium Poly30]